jgi:hypothetical protein
MSISITLVECKQSLQGVTLAFRGGIRRNADGLIVPLIKTFRRKSANGLIERTACSEDISESIPFSLDLSSDLFLPEA